MSKLKLTHPSIYCLYGKPASGKSNLIKYIAYHYKKKKLVDFIYVMSGSSFNGYYQNFLDEKLVVPYTDDKLEQLLGVCANKKEKGDKFRTLLILDDCLGSTSWKKPVILKLINNHRHYNISLIIATQYPNQVSPNIRSNCNLAFIFLARTKRELQALYESYGMGFFNTLPEFSKFIKNLEKYQCLVVNNREQEFSKVFSLFTAPNMDKKK